MVRSIEITKASVRDRLVVDVEVWMNDPEDFDFSPRASVDGNSLSICNEGDEDARTSIELDNEIGRASCRERV